MTHEYFTTTDGQNIFCTVWNETKRPRAIVLIMCGIDDTIERYQEFAEYLNVNGYVVFGTCNIVENTAEYGGGFYGTKKYFPCRSGI